MNKYAAGVSGTRRVKDKKRRTDEYAGRPYKQFRHHTIMSHLWHTDG